jgi:hypothetical protein
MTLSELHFLPKNFSLLALISDRKGITKKNPFPTGVLDLQSTNQLSMVDEEPNPSNSDKEFADKAIASQPYCERHKMLIHSFVPGTRQLLCDKCISGLPKNIAHICPIPKVCKDLRQKIIRAMNKLSLKKSEVSQCKAIIHQLTDSNRIEVENSINEYYQKLNEIISDSEKKTRERFKLLCETQNVLASSHNVCLSFLK